MIVRQDISLEQQAVQAVHAAVEAGRQGLLPSSGEHPTLVLCGQPTEADLYHWSRHLTIRDIPHICFREPDQHNALTAIATGLVTESQRRSLNALPLLRLQEVA